MRHLYVFLQMSDASSTTLVPKETQFYFTIVRLDLGEVFLWHHNLWLCSEQFEFRHCMPNSSDILWILGRICFCGTFNIDSSKTGDAY